MRRGTESQMVGMWRVQAHADLKSLHAAVVKLATLADV